MEEKSNIAQQILDANKQHNKVLTLNELITAKKNGEIGFEVKEAIDRYVYVHVTDFMPENNKITTNADKEKNGKIDESYDGHAEGRDTVHFTVNGRVLSHANGNWNQRKYAVVMLGREFMDKNNESIVSINTEDTIVEGNADISGSFIICPQTDYEEMQKRNPNIVVIPIEAERAVDVKERNDDFVYDFIINVLDLEHKKCAQNGWLKVETALGTNLTYISDAVDWGAIDKYCQVIDRYVGRELPRLQHQFSYTKSLTELRNGYGYNRNNLRDLYQSPEKQGVSLEKMEEIATEIDRLLAEKDGLGMWSSLYGNFSELDESTRKDHSKKIDEYLGIGIKDVYDGDIITTNIKRIQMISDKMKSEGKSEESKKMLQYALRYFLQDYVIMRDNFTKRADMKDLDFEEYTKKIKQEFSQIGIRIEELDSLEESEFYSNEVKDISDRITTENEIQRFLVEQGIEEERDIDFNLRDAKRLLILGKIQQDELIASAKAGKYDNYGYIDLSKICKQASRMGKNVIESLIQGIETDGMTNEIETLLKMWGLSDKELEINRIKQEDE